MAGSGSRTELSSKSIPSSRWLLIAVATMALALGVFLFYFLVYPLQHLSLPLGFDTPWYIWRAEFVAHERIGPIGTAARPGHALLSALLGSLSGIPQVELAAVFPLILTSVFALSMGALAWAALGGDVWRWGIVMALAGTVLATTRLPGENVANLLNLLLVVGAVAFLCGWVADGRGFWGAVLLLVASGLAHLLFLGVFGVIFALAAVVAAPSSLRASRSGHPLVRTETGALAALGAVLAALLGALFAWLPGTPLETFVGIDDRQRFLPKLRNDLLRLAFLAPAGLFGAALLPTRRGVIAGDASAIRRRRFFLRMLGCWAAVCAGGLLYALLTTRLPPHRFLALIVAVPGAFALAATTAFISWWFGRSSETGEAKGRWLAVGASALTVLALTIPGAVTWYSQGPGQWLDGSTLRQARTAGTYMSGLPPGQPVVFLIDTSGRAGALSPALKERTIRAALPPERMADAHFFVGVLRDLLRGKRTLAGTDMNRATLAYWQDVRSVLGPNTPTLVLRATARKAFREAMGEGAGFLVGPGVALVRGPRPERSPLPAAPSVRVPGIGRALLEGALLLSLLAIAGAGWTLALLGPRQPEVMLPMAPVVGAAVLIIGALPANLAGIPFTRPAAAFLYAGLTLVGATLAGASSLRRRADRSRNAPSGDVG